MEEEEIVMEAEFKIKLSKEKDIRELCALLDKWNKEGEKQK